MVALELLVVLELEFVELVVFADSSLEYFVNRLMEFAVDIVVTVAYFRLKNLNIDQ